MKYLLIQTGTDTLNPVCTITNAHRAEDVVYLVGRVFT